MNTFIIPLLLLTASTEPNNLDIALHCIHGVESSFGRDKRDGDNGNAIGEYQIHKVYWKDGTKILKVNWDYKEARNRRKAEQVIRSYLMHYQRANKYPTTVETYCRLHNGGPAGPKSKSTQVYWNKCKQYLPKKGK